VQYEIEQSIARKNGLLVIHIHHLENMQKQTSARGARPSVPVGVDFPCYDWDRDLQRLATSIEEAGRRADRLRERRTWL
jgi:hypothetical protein